MNCSNQKSLFISKLKPLSDGQKIWNKLLYKPYIYIEKEKERYYKDYQLVLKQEIF